eukprot:g5845.t1
MQRQLFPGLPSFGSRATSSEEFAAKKEADGDQLDKVSETGSKEEASEEGSRALHSPMAVASKRRNEAVAKVGAAAEQKGSVPGGEPQKTAPSSTGRMSTPWEQEVEDVGRDTAFSGTSAGGVRPLQFAPQRVARAASTAKAAAPAAAPPGAAAPPPAATSAIVVPGMASSRATALERPQLAAPTVRAASLSAKPSQDPELVRPQLLSLASTSIYKKDRTTTRDSSTKRASTTSDRQLLQAGSIVAPSVPPAMIGVSPKRTAAPTAGAPSDHETSSGSASELQRDAGRENENNFRSTPVQAELVPIEVDEVDSGSVTPKERPAAAGESAAKTTPPRKRFIKARTIRTASAASKKDDATSSSDSFMLMLGPSALTRPEMEFPALPGVRHMLPEDRTSRPGSKLSVFDFGRAGSTSPAPPKKPAPSASRDDNSTARSTATPPPRTTTRAPSTRVVSVRGAGASGFSRDISVKATNALAVPMIDAFAVPPALTSDEDLRSSRDEVSGRGQHQEEARRSSLVSVDLNPPAPVSYHHWVQEQGIAPLASIVGTSPAARARTGVVDDRNSLNESVQPLLIADHIRDTKQAGAGGKVGTKVPTAPPRVVGLSSKTGSRRSAEDETTSSAASDAGPPADMGRTTRQPQTSPSPSQKVAQGSSVQERVQQLRAEADEILRQVSGRKTSARKTTTRAMRRSRRRSRSPFHEVQQRSRGGETSSGRKNVAASTTTRSPRRAASASPRSTRRSSSSKRRPTIEKINMSLSRSQSPVERQRRRRSAIRKLSPTQRLMLHTSSSSQKPHVVASSKEGASPSPRSSEPNDLHMVATVGVRLPKPSRSRSATPQPDDGGRNTPRSGPRSSSERMRRAALVPPLGGLRSGVDIVDMTTPRRRRGSSAHRASGGSRPADDRYPLRELLGAGGGVPRGVSPQGGNKVVQSTASKPTGRQHADGGYVVSPRLAALSTPHPRQARPKFEDGLLAPESGASQRSGSETPRGAGAAANTAKKPAFGAGKPTTDAMRKQKAAEYYSKITRTPDAVRRHKGRGSDFRPEFVTDEALLREHFESRQETATRPRQMRPYSVKKVGKRRASSVAGVEGGRKKRGLISKGVGDHEVLLMRVSEKKIGAGNQDLRTNADAAFEVLSSASSASAADSAEPPGKLTMSSVVPKSPLPPFSDLVRQSRLAAARQNAEGPPRRPQWSKTSSDGGVKVPRSPDSSKDPVWDSQSLLLAGRGGEDALGLPVHPVGVEAVQGDGPLVPLYSLDSNRINDVLQSPVGTPVAAQSPASASTPASDEKLGGGATFTSVDKKRENDVLAPQDEGLSQPRSSLADHPSVRRLSSLLQAVQDAETRGDRTAAESLLPLLTEAKREAAAVVPNAGSKSANASAEVAPASVRRRSSAAEIDALILDAQNLDLSLSRFGGGPISPGVSLRSDVQTVDGLNREASSLSAVADRLAAKTSMGTNFFAKQERRAAPSSSASSRAGTRLGGAVRKMALFGKKNTTIQESLQAALRARETRLGRTGAESVLSDVIQEEDADGARVTEQQDSVRINAASQKSKNYEKVGKGSGESATSPASQERLASSTGTLRETIDVEDGLAADLQEQRETRGTASSNLLPILISERSTTARERELEAVRRSTVDVLDDEVDSAITTGAAPAAAAVAEVHRAREQENGASKNSFLYFGENDAEGGSDDDFEDTNSVLTLTCRSTQSGYWTPEDTSDVDALLLSAEDRRAAAASSGLCEQGDLRPVAVRETVSPLVHEEVLQMNDDYTNELPQFGRSSAPAAGRSFSANCNSNLVHWTTHYVDELENASPKPTPVLGHRFLFVDERTPLHTPPSNDEGVEVENLLLTPVEMPTTPRGAADSSLVPTDIDGDVDATVQNLLMNSNPATSIPTTDAAPPSDLGGHFQRLPLSDLLREIGGTSYFNGLSQPQRWALVMEHMKSLEKTPVVRLGDEAVAPGGAKTSPKLDAFMRSSHTPSTQNLSLSMRLVRGLKAPVSVSEGVARSANATYQRRLDAYLDVIGAHASCYVTEQENRILLGDLFVDEEMAPLLREVFEHYCNVGDRTNTEWMGAKKWVKLLLDARICDPASIQDALQPAYSKHNKKWKTVNVLEESPGATVIGGGAGKNAVEDGMKTNAENAPASPRGGARAGTSTTTSPALSSAPTTAIAANSNGGQQEQGVVGTKLLTIAEAELVHKKVVTSCDPGMHRFSFDLFCKALAVLALRASSAKQQLQQKFANAKTALQFVFRNVILFCFPKHERSAGRVLDDVRISEIDVEILLHHREFLCNIFDEFTSKHGADPNCALDIQGSSCSTKPRRGASDRADPSMKTVDRRATTAAVGAQKRAERTFVANTLAAAAFRKRNAGVTAAGGNTNNKAGLLHVMESIHRNPDNRYSPVTYQVSDGTLNGVCVVRDSASTMSFRQFLSVMKALGVHGEVLQTHSVLAVFKAAATCRSELGLLNRARFLEAVAFVAIAAMSRPPYVFEYEGGSNGNSSKIYGFLDRVRDKNRDYPKKPLENAFRTNNKCQM